MNLILTVASILDKMKNFHWLLLPQKLSMLIFKFFLKSSTLGVAWCGSNRTLYFRIGSFSCITSIIIHVCVTFLRAFWLENIIPFLFNPIHGQDAHNFSVKLFIFLFINDSSSFKVFNLKTCISSFTLLLLSSILLIMVPSTNVCSFQILKNDDLDLKYGFGRS